MPLLHALLLASGLQVAVADVAPYPPPVRELPCRAADRQDYGEECVECLVTLGAADRCGGVLQSYDFSLECKGKVSFYRREVWCRSNSGTPKTLPSWLPAFLEDPKGKAPTPPTPPTPTIPEVPAPPDQDGSWHQNCSSTGLSAGLAPALLALALGLGRRRSTTAR